MKKVLLISYYFPPAGGPGSQRVVKFAKYLPKFGWQPIILTVKKGEFPYQDVSLKKDIPPQAKVYRTPSLEPFLIYKQLTGKRAEEPLPVGMLIEPKKGITEKIASWIRANLFIPDARIGWLPFAVAAGLKILQKENIDILFTSSPPHSSQLIGLVLKKFSGLPWVADLRDPWTGIRYYNYIKRISVSRFIDGTLEQYILKNADAVTSVSASLLEEFRSKLPEPSKPQFKLIPNGFDAADFPETTQSVSKEFVILYTGNLQENQNSPAFWKSITRLLQKYPELNETIKIYFYGKTAPFLQKEIRKYGIARLVRTFNFIPHEQIVKEIKKATILLVIIPDTENNKGIVTGKIFEYIGSGRPILLFGPEEGDAARILKPFPNSWVCNYTDSESCLNFLEKIISLWKQGTIPKVPEKIRLLYSRENLTKNLADLFNSLK